MRNRFEEFEYHLQTVLKFFFEVLILWAIVIQFVGKRVTHSELFYRRLNAGLRVGGENESKYTRLKRDSKI